MLRTTAASPIGQVDEEDQPPVPVRHDIATQRRAERRAGHDRDGEEAERLAALLGRERLEQGADGERQQQSADEALQRAADDQHPEGGREPAQHGRRGEDGQGEDPDHLHGEAPLEEAGEWRRDAAGQRVGGDHPLHGRDVDAEDGAELGQCDVDDGHVDQEDRHAGQHGDQDEPLVGEAAARGAGRGGRTERQLGGGHSYILAGRTEERNLFRVPRTHACPPNLERLQAVRKGHRRGELLGPEPAQLDQVVRGPRLAADQLGQEVQVERVDVTLVGVDQNRQQLGRCARPGRSPRRARARPPPRVAPRGRGSRPGYPIRRVPARCPAAQAGPPRPG